MSQETQIEFQIKKNILYLAKANKNIGESQRNLLNKWFQDSIKNYILEQIASPLIYKFLTQKCSSQAEIKAFIRKDLDQTKPVYMHIIERYFFYINEFNQKEVFIKKLNETIQNPIDVTLKDYSKDYNTLKIVRKQFVCYLILRFFEIYGKQQISSFYELWNICFPEERQIKKKLSKYDIKKEKKKTRPYNRKKNIQNNTQAANYLSNPLNNGQCLSFAVNFNVQNTQPSSTQNYKQIQNLEQSFQDKNQITQNECYQKKQIKSGILEEDDDEEEEEYINLCNEYYQFSCQESFCKKEEYSSELIDTQKNNVMLNTHQISYYNQYQNTFQNQNCNYFQLNGQNRGLQGDRYYCFASQYQNQQKNQQQQINTFQLINQIKKEEEN